MEKERTLLAILGRGIQKTASDGLWDLTEDIEVCDERFAHLPIRVPQDDDHPNSIVGGGHLNLLAGLKLAEKLDPTIIVCAYGYRSEYLKSIDAPSESMIMSIKFIDLNFMTGRATRKVCAFDEEAWTHLADRPSNTNQEIDNIFRQALFAGIYNVAIVAVGVHTWRSNLMAQLHLSSGMPHYNQINLQFYASENVLLEADPEKYGERCRALTGSKSYQRNFQKEQDGVNALLSGKYNSIQSASTSKA